MSVNDITSKKIAPTQCDYQSVCGLDALYFYIKVKFLDYSDFYVNHLLRGHLENENFILLSKDYNNQFTYFQHLGEIKTNIPRLPNEGFSPLQEICRIGFKNLNQKDNLDSIIIQMNSNALQQMNINDIKDYFNNLLNSFGLEILKFQVSRVDINTYVFDYDFEWINYNSFSTKLKKNEPKYNGNTLETFYLGSRGNGLFLRIYNKLKQLSSLDFNEGNLKQYLIDLKYLYKYKKVANYSQLWNIELELRRQQLRLYKIDTLDDLNNKVNSLHKMVFTNSIRLLEESKKMNTHDNRIPSHSVWCHIVDSFDYNGFPVTDIDKEKLKEYRRDKIWLRNRLVEFLEEERNTDFYLREKVSELLEYMNRYTDINRLFKEPKNG